MIPLDKEFESIFKKQKIQLSHKIVRFIFLGSSLFMEADIQECIDQRKIF